MSIGTVSLRSSHPVKVDDELVNILKKYGNNPNDWPALHYAVECQDERAIEVLLKNGMDPNLKVIISKDGKNNPLALGSTLHIAMHTHERTGNHDLFNPRIINLLLEYGADPYSFNQYTHNTPGNLTPVGYIVQQYCNKSDAINNPLYNNQPDYKEKCIKFRSKLIEVLDVFSARKIDFNKFCCNNRGDTTVHPELTTPLRMAVHTKYQDDYIIRFLLEHGAELIDA